MLTQASTHIHHSLKPTAQSKNGKRVFQPFPPTGRIPLLQKLYAGPRLVSPARFACWHLAKTIHWMVS